MTTSREHPGPRLVAAGGLAQRLRSAAREGAAVLRRTVRIPVTRMSEALRRLRRGPAAAAHADPQPAPAGEAGRAPDMPATTGRIGARRLARRLSIVVTALLAGASTAGLCWPGLYRDPTATTALFRGYDLGSLAVATPLLAGALARARHGSPRADLLWAGMLAYVAYTYAYYVFGAAFNALFLVHVALFVLAASALVLALWSTDVDAVAARFSERTPVRAIGGALTVLAAGLGGMWTFNSLRFAVTGVAPPEGLLVQPAPIGHLGYAMDLTTLVPGYAAAATLLWRRRPWGYVVAAVLLIASTVVQIDYMLALLFQAAARVPGATAFDPQEPYIAAMIAAAAAALLANLSRHRARSVSPSSSGPSPFSWTKNPSGSATAS